MKGRFPMDFIVVFGPVFLVGIIISLLRKLGVNIQTKNISSQTDSILNDYEKWNMIYNTDDD
jgi:hypothetical protein